MKSSFQSPDHPHDLNPSQVPLCCASRSSSVLISELHASNGSISNCCDEENSPDTGNNSTDGENQDLNAGENEWSVGGNDECLDRCLNGGFGGCCGCLCKNSVYECCFAAGEGSVNSLTVGCHACQCDCREEELLEGGTIIISFSL